MTRETKGPLTEEDYWRYDPVQQSDLSIHRLAEDQPLALLRSPEGVPDPIRFMHFMRAVYDRLGEKDD